MVPMEIAPSPELLAYRFGLILGKARCACCHAESPTAAVWVDDYEERDESGATSGGGPAVLRFTEWMEETALVQVRALAPWLKMAYTRTSGSTYLAHHCTTCGALQGDHFIHSPDGPYWPHDDSELASFWFVPCKGPLSARTCASESPWMAHVETCCSRAPSAAALH